MLTKQKAFFCVFGLAFIVTAYTDICQRMGMMDANFYEDLNRLGLEYGQRMMKALEKTFHFQEARVERKKNEGVETSATTHVLEFYTPKTLRQVLEYVAIDYFLLNISIPEWAERMIDEDARDSERALIDDRNI